MANGAAPLEASSGRTKRNRLNRGGNRQLDRAIHTISITQIAWEKAGRGFLNLACRNRANLGPLVPLPTLENGGDVFCDLLLESRFPILGQERSGDRIAG